MKTGPAHAGLTPLAAALGHAFADSDLLAEALTHPSAVKRGAVARRGYERLEFLGDRVLGLVVAELLWRRFPDEAEGDLTRRLVHLVRRETLIEVAKNLKLGTFLAASAGETASGVHHNPSVLGDICEAVIGALYLDGGIEAARRFVERGWGERLTDFSAPPRDPKTALQEWAQARGLKLPLYKLVKMTGPPHRRRFTVSVSVEGLAEAKAIGASKRVAEAAAAAAALIEADKA